MIGETTIDDTVINLGVAEEHEGYFQLVWRRFRRSTVSIVGALMVLMLVFLAVFADFFSPTSLSDIDLHNAFIPPQKIHFIDEEGNFHLRPFVYNYVYTIDPVTFQVYWEEDKSKPYEIKFFVQGSEYKLLGLIPSPPVMGYYPSCLPQQVECMSAPTAFVPANSLYRLMACSVWCCSQRMPLDSK